MSVRSWIDRLTSPEAKSMLRTAAHLVLDFVGDDRIETTGATEGAASSSDAAKVASAVAATASVAERLVSAATKASSKKRSGSGRGGKIALGIAVGAAVIGGIAWVASPKGRAKARELWHTARGWKKPRSSNGAPVEVPPPL
jgi:hypothetical protein